MIRHVLRWLAGLNPGSVWALRSQIAAYIATAGTGRQPISSAPRDGSKVELFGGGYDGEVGYWTDSKGGRWFLAAMPGWWFEDPPTHWRPVRSAKGIAMTATPSAGCGRDGHTFDLRAGEGHLHHGGGWPPHIFKRLKMVAIWKNFRMTASFSSRDS